MKRVGKLSSVGIKEDAVEVDSTEVEGYSEYSGGEWADSVLRTVHSVFIEFLTHQAVR